MLVSMTVRNIALIEQLQIEFQKGMQVLSGETGAGKSIIVDSINLVLGGARRPGADPLRVRPGLRGSAGGYFRLPTGCGGAGGAAA